MNTNSVFLDDNCTNRYFMGSVLVFVVASFVYCSSLHTEISNLQAKNKTLKGIILKTLDRTFVYMLKNGYDADSENDE